MTGIALILEHNNTYDKLINEIYVKDSICGDSYSRSHTACGLAPYGGWNCLLKNMEKKKKMGKSDGDLNGGGK